MTVLGGVTLLLFFGGFILLFGLLAKHEALNKLKQFGAMADMASGRLGPQSKKLFLLSLVMMLFGACGLMANVTAQDGVRRRQCVAECKKQGYAEGKIGPSKASDPVRRNRALFVACTCSGHPSAPPLELKADELPKQ